MTICMSPWPNFSDSSRAACHDSLVGSWRPPADRLLVTGMPKMPVPTMTSSATAMIRRGDAMASRAIPCNTSILPSQVVSTEFDPARPPPASTHCKYSAVHRHSLRPGPAPACRSTQELMLATRSAAVRPRSAWISLRAAVSEESLRHTDTAHRCVDSRLVHPGRHC